MKKMLSVLMFLMGLSLQANTKYPPEFSVTNEQGQTIWYAKIDDKTCAVTYETEIGLPGRHTQNYKGDLVIPKTVSYEGNEFTVTTVGMYAFVGSEELTSISFPATITEICDNAFEFMSERVTAVCPKLTKLSFASVESFLNIGFYNCILPENFDGNLYINGKLVTDLVIPESIENLYSTNPYSNILPEISGLRSVTFEGGPKRFKESKRGAAFRNCVNLEKVAFASIEQLLNMDYDIDDMWNGEEDRFYNNPLYHGTDLYIGGEKKTAIDLPEGTETVGIGVLAGLKGVKVNLASTVTNIGDYAFYNAGIDKIELPEALNRIGTSAFAGTKIEYLSIPAQCKEIGKASFANCSALKEVVIPRSVKRLGEGMFGGCTAIEKVMCMSSVPPSARYYDFPMGNDQQIHSTLLVPKGSKEAYLKDDAWGCFERIEEFDSDENEEDLQCPEPEIGFADGRLVFSNGVDHAHFCYTITALDATSEPACCDQNGKELTLTYLIEAYAVAEGYLDSDKVQATLCWLGGDVNPTDPNLSNPILTAANPVLIKCQSNSIVIEGARDIERIEFYAPSGAYLGAEAVFEGHASFDTSEPIVIVRIGEKTVKVQR